MLLRKRNYFEAIRHRTKTTTLRYWKSARLRSGSVPLVPGLGRLRIERIVAVTIGDLTDADARADGFVDLTELQRALEEVYPIEAREGRTLYQIHFTFLSSTD